MRSEQRHWRDLIRAWDTGPACGLDAARQFTAAHPEQFRGWVVMANVLCSMARYAEAGRAMQRAARTATAADKPFLWEQWGLMQRERYDLRRAERWFRKAVAAQASTRRHGFLGATLARQGRLLEALAEHRAGIALSSPDEPVDEAHLNAALVLRGLERYEEAREHLVHANQLDRKYKEAQRVLRDIDRVLARRHSRLTSA